MRMIQPMMVVAAVPLLFASAAFAQRQPAPPFGESVRNNIAVQVGDMNPVYHGTEIEGGNGQRAADAVRRYEQGRIKEPRGNTASGAQIEQGGSSVGASSAPPKGQ